MEEAIQRLTQERTAKSERIKDLTHELDTYSQSIQLLNMKLQNREDEIEDLRNEMADLRESVERLTAEKERAFREKREALERVKDLENALTRASEEAVPEVAQPLVPLKAD